MGGFDVGTFAPRLLAEGCRAARRLYSRGSLDSGARLLFLAALYLSIARPLDRLSAATIGLNFAGASFSIAGFFPPDSVLAAGRSHLVELVNGRMNVYRKSDGVRLQTQSLSAFFRASGINVINYAFDPRVVFDPTTERWYAAAADNVRSANQVLFAVSTTSDPTSAWRGFGIDSDPSNTRWADFPMLGFDSAGVYLTANMFSLGGDYDMASAFALPKSGLLASPPTVAGLRRFDNASFYPAPQPVVDYTAGGSPARFFRSAGTDNVQRWSLTGAFPNVSLQTTLEPAIRLPRTNSLTDADQPGPRQDIDTGDGRFSGSVVNIAGTIWTVQTVESTGGRAALRWLKIDEATNELLQHGLLTDPQLEFYYGSIAANQFGDVVIGASGSSAQRNVSTFAFVGSTSPTGTTSFEPAMLLRAGTGSYEFIDPSGRNRWGDYSATVVDPTDPFRFWTIQERVSGSDNWTTQITEIRVVPEPATIVIAANGLVVLLLFARRRTI